MTKLEQAAYSLYEVRARNEQIDAEIKSLDEKLRKLDGEREARQKALYLASDVLSAAIKDYYEEQQCLTNH